ncbi:hypothetical protein BX600DRAFT_436271 [Xylariales sp. PMI_506]|nr:hypothetical protein BX600DRAFT_436271 [Xylariales sp. PMI_506]
MKLYMLLLTSFGLITSSICNPVEPRDAWPTVDFTFHAAAVSFPFSIPADGKVYSTNSDLNINIIETPDYNAIQQCQFYTPGQQTLVNEISPEGLQRIIIGPPQPVTAVSCWGSCVATYGDCYGSNGQPIGPCCCGFCAAAQGGRGLVLYYFH